MKMKSKFVWLCITFYVIAVTVATPADPSRPRRDLTRIQNIIKWLLGINERNLFQTVPLIGNEQQRVFTIPAHEPFLLRAPPQLEVNGNVRQILKAEPYPERLYPSVQTIRNPFIYNSYPSAVQEYAQIRDGGYVYRRPMYPTNRLPTYQESVRPLCPISITNVEACGYDTRGIITETSQPLPPMHIRNRMREIIVNHPVSPLNVQQDIVMPPLQLRKVNVFDYSRNQDKTVNDATLIKTEEQVKPILSVKLNSEADTIAQGLITKTDIITKNKVTFAAPVHSKYRYKMIYHNQPERNTVVEMDSMGSSTAKPNEETSSPSVKESTNMMNNPANYIYMPPVNTEIPPPGLPSDITAYKKSEESDNYSAAASENKLIVDDSTFTNKDKPSRVIIRRRKLKSRKENGRGDIPDISLQ